mmetsp:Transcript_67940/g.196701  ORF Transcript_67940/g.196701 Transcript_67940/m.196701 type:complete len:338 (-) Transcript_67940:345-1358(-)
MSSSSTWSYSSSGISTPSLANNTFASSRLSPAKNFTNVTSGFSKSARSKLSQRGRRSRVARHDVVVSGDFSGMEPAWSGNRVNAIRNPAVLPIAEVTFTGEPSSEHPPLSALRNNSNCTPSPRSILFVDQSCSASSFSSTPIRSANNCDTNGSDNAQPWRALPNNTSPSCGRKRTSPKSSSGQASMAALAQSTAARNLSSNSEAVMALSQRQRSKPLMKRTGFTRSRTACRIKLRVCCSTPSATSTTTTAASLKRKAAATSPAREAEPGVSIKYTKDGRVLIWGEAEASEDGSCITRDRRRIKLRPPPCPPTSIEGRRGCAKRCPAPSRSGCEAARS